MPGKNRRNVLVGEALRRSRKAAGISQEELAFEAKIDRTYVSQLENGHKSPTVDVLFRICPVLGMAASELIAQAERSLQSRRK
ncbi:MAG: helix-turn-helix transcriptional regulator [Pirellulales bacterium]